MKRKGLRYYLVNYIPFYYEIDRYIKTQVLKYMKKRLLARTKTKHRQEV